VVNVKPDHLIGLRPSRRQNDDTPLALAALQAGNVQAITQHCSMLLRSVRG
jgi:hypothetical protein